MKLLFILLFAFPSLLFGFSETELESLEDSGTKIFSKSPWRKSIGFSLLRNLEIETRHENFTNIDTDSDQENLSKKRDKLCDPQAEDSLCDLSNLYYSWDFTVYYSLAQWSKKYLNYSFLKGTELFLGSAFTSNFSGGDCFHLEGYDNFTGYIKCGLGDISGGWTMPVYKKGSNFFSYFNFSSIIWPLSKKSSDASLKTSLNASISTLYFIKKQDKWSGAFSSNHSLAYNHFTQPITENKGYSYSNPLNSKQQINLIFKQSFNKYLPANTNLSLSYNLVLNTENTYWILDYIEETSTAYWNEAGEQYKEFLPVIKENCTIKNYLGSVIACGNRYHQLALGLNSSWKLKQRAYLTLSARWKDLIKVNNSFNKKVRLKSPPSLRLYKWFFTLRASYSF